MSGSRYEYAFVRLNDGLYDDDIATGLAETFDICVNAGGIEGADAAQAFVNSGLARRFEQQNPAYVAGKSGAELARFLADYLHKPLASHLPARYERSVDYWVGWSVAHFQLVTGRPYRAVFDAVPYNELAGMYHPLHEADESKFIEILSLKLSDAAQKRPIGLRSRREAAGLSQAELARCTGVGLRAIQMYEQRNKDINHAQAWSLYRLSQALGCSMEDLLEA